MLYRHVVVFLFKQWHRLLAGGGGGGGTEGARGGKTHTSDKKIEEVI